MSAPDKCPKCGAPISSYGPEMYECGTCPGSAHPLGCWHGDTLVPSGLCLERAAHAETRKKLSEVETKETCSGYAAQKLREHCGLDNSKEDLSEVYELVTSLRSELAEARRKWEADRALLGGALDLLNPNGIKVGSAELIAAADKVEETRRKLGEAEKRWDALREWATGARPTTTIDVLEVMGKAEKGGAV